jgi:predicted DNA-binding protein (MmcQ/YjbR family)
MAEPKRTRRQLLKFALGMPGAWEDHPWDEDVAKVGKRVFAFFGLEEYEGRTMITLKLRESHAAAVGVPGVEPSGYGLGKSGWVTITLGEGTPSLGVLSDWVEESYRLVAPARLVTELDRRG